MAATEPEDPYALTDLQVRKIAREAKEKARAKCAPKLFNELPFPELKDQWTRIGAAWLMNRLLFKNFHSRCIGGKIGVTIEFVTDGGVNRQQILVPETTPLKLDEFAKEVISCLSNCSPQGIVSTLKRSWYIEVSGGRNAKRSSKSAQDAQVYKWMLPQRRFFATNAAYRNFGKPGSLADIITDVAYECADRKQKSQYTKDFNAEFELINKNLTEELYNDESRRAKIDRKIAIRDRAAARRAKAEERRATAKRR